MLGAQSAEMSHPGFETFYLRRVLAFCRQIQRGCRGDLFKLGEALFNLHLQLPTPIRRNCSLAYCGGSIPYRGEGDLDLFRPIAGNRTRPAASG